MKSLFTKIFSASLIVMLALAVLPVTPARAAITAVNANIGTATNKTAGTTLAITTTSAVVAGDDIVITFAMDNAAGTVSVADSAGNTYTSYADVANAGGVRTLIFAAFNVTALPNGSSITITHPSIAARAGTASNFRGLAPSGAFDQSNTGTGTSTTPSSGATPTTTQADELLIGAIGTEGPQSGGGEAAGAWQNSFTNGPRVGTTGGGGDTNITTSMGYRIVNATGSYTASKTGITSRDWAAAIATFRMDTTNYTITASAGAGGTITPSGAVSVQSHNNQTFDIVPSTGNVVLGVSIDGGASVGRVNHYTFSNVIANHTIAATFDGGWSAPSAFSDPDTDVGTPANIYTSNDSYAIFGNSNDEVVYQNFGLSIPNGATINGIEVAIEGYSEGARNAVVSLSWDNGTTITSSVTTAMPTTTAASEATVILGGPANTWGRTWSDTEFANGSFAVRVGATTGGGTDLFLDQLQVKVYYTVPTTLTLQKIMVNDNGGNATSADFTPSINGTPTTWGTTVTLAPGEYTLSETGPTGYSNTGIWDCVGDTGPNGDDDIVSLLAGDAATCTIINDDQQGSLQLVKVVTNDNGGTLTNVDFPFTDNIPGTLGAPVITGSAPTLTYTYPAVAVDAGAYTFSEGDVAGYTEGTWSCTGATATGTAYNAGGVTVPNGGTVVCSITNNDNPTTLTLVKQVTNDHGGTNVVADWALTADGNSFTSGVSQNVTPGTYTLAETGPSGYTASAWVCVGGTQVGSDITLALGESATCTITNDDDAASLTLVKQVTNDNGGTNVIADWTLTADGNSFTSGVSQNVSAGTYTLAESGPSGYTASAWSCVGGTQAGSDITLALGESATCTITNDDQQASLTLVKQVTNDNGGTNVVADWTLTADGNTFTSGVSQNVNAGTYTLAETGPSGYSASAWNCVGGTQAGSDITLAPGESATCTITNDDDAASLTLVKQVTNDNGGTNVVADWTLTADGTGFTSGVSQNVNPGTYTLAESGPNGYSASTWNCVGGSQSGSDITLALGESSTCTITNDDVAPTLTLVKDITNNDGGTSVNNDWTLDATGPSNINGVGGTAAVTNVTVDAGSYSLSESGPAGYTNTAISCDGNDTDGSDGLDLDPGENVTCTFDNDDIGATLTLLKDVTNDNIGAALNTDWTLTATGSTTISGTEGDAAISGAGVSAGDYTLTESGPANYTQTAITCSGGLDTDGSDGLTLALGEVVICTFFNDDDVPVLLVPNVNSNPDTGDGSVSENEIIASTLNTSQLLVQFNWDAYDIPASTTDPDEVDNPANYRLLYSATGTFNTLGCVGPIVAPDLNIPSVTSVTYSDGGGSGPFIATLTLSAPLTTVGYYRLYVCGTTSIVLQADTTVALAGDSVTAGSDFTRNFQVAAPTTLGGGGGGGGKEGRDGPRITTLGVSALPATGFAPNRVTVVPEQPEELAYASLGDLWIEIPALGVKTSIVGVPLTAEDEWDVTWLANSVGWLNGTAFPTWEGNSVLTAHVTNADGLDGPFANLKKLKYGDQIIVHLYGEKYTFEITNSRLSRPFTTGFAFEDLEDESYLTLITCQLYNPKNDTYFFRRVVRAVLVSVESE